MYNWQQLSYAYIFSVIQNQRFLNTAGNNLHPDAVGPYEFMVECIQKHKCFPSYEQIYHRFGLDARQFDFHFPLEELGSLLELERTKYDVQYVMVELQKTLSMEGATVQDFLNPLVKMQEKLYKQSAPFIWELTRDWEAVLAYFQNQSLSRVCQFGFPTLDTITGGISNDDYILLFANSTQGKSTFARLIAANVAMQGKRVLYLTLEESGVKSIAKTASHIVQVSSKHVILNSITEFERRNLWNNHHFLADCPGKVFFVDRVESKTVGEIAKLSWQTQPDLIILDQIPHFTQDGKSDAESITQVSKNLKAFVQYHKLPMIALTQAKTRSNIKSPSMEENIAFAYAQGQDATIALFLHPDEPGPGYTRKRLFVAKNRDAERGQSIDFRWSLNDGIIEEEGSFFAKNVTNTDLRTYTFQVTPGTQPNQ